jgi:hypothetical protein
MNQTEYELIAQRSKMSAFRSFQATELALVAQPIGLVATV